MVAEIAAQSSATALRSSSNMNDPYPIFCWGHSSHKDFVPQLSSKRLIEERSVQRRNECQLNLDKMREKCQLQSGKLAFPRQSVPARGYFVALSLGVESSQVRLIDRTHRDFTAGSASASFVRSESKAELPPARPMPAVIPIPDFRPSARAPS